MDERLPAAIELLLAKGAPAVRLVRQENTVMAVGWAQDGAVQDQIDATVASEVARARSRMAQGASLEFCADCEEPIPAARRLAVPGVTRCVRCQEEADRDDQRSQLFNRRGSKDSQLR